MKLTDLGIKALKAPETGAIIYGDDALTGFWVRVSLGGPKAFVVTPGKLRRAETIGRVGVISLADARRRGETPAGGIHPGQAGPGLDHVVRCS